MLLKRSRTNKSKLLPEGRRYKVLGGGEQYWSRVVMPTVRLPCDTHSDPHAVTVVCTAFYVYYYTLHSKSYIKNLMNKALNFMLYFSLSL